MKLFERKDYGTWDVWRKSYSINELLTRRQQLAKVANSRIRRLESKKSFISGKILFTQEHYDIIKFVMGDKKRFSESKNYKGGMIKLKNEITALETWLGTKSSTVGGMRDIEEKRSQKFISKGVPEEIAYDYRFYEFLSSDIFDDLDLYVDSSDIIDYFVEIDNDKLTFDKLLNLFNEYLAGHTKEGYKWLEDRVYNKQFEE